jgi:hypothetical protein
MKILPQKDGMDGFFATVLKRKWKKKRSKRFKSIRLFFNCILIFYKKIAKNIFNKQNFHDY